MKRIFQVVVLLLPLTSHVSRLTAQQGSWQSEGYGYYLEFRNDSLLFHEVTAVSCIPTSRGTKVDAPAGALSAYRLTESPVTFIILPTDGGRLRLHMNGAASDIVIRPGQRPALCNRPTPDSPTSNFDVFAATWAEQYGFFDLKRADWKAIVAANRPRITDTSPPESLLAVFSGMIEPLHDAHTFISAGSVGRFGGARKSANSLERADFDKAYALAEKYVKQPLHKFCNGRLEFSMLADDIGYLRIRGFFGYHPDGTFESGLSALQAALDTVFANASRWRGLVIDVRINGGGADPYGLTIASRLASAPYLAYTKEARADPNDPTKWTPGQDSPVVPSAPGFKGPVVLLTGVHSVSAAETFTQALMHRTPKVTRMGENTQGVFSDVLGRKLPNGWRFGLPNERFITDGKTWDGPGIPPDIEVPVFARADLEAGKDVALERAIELVSRKP